MDDTNEVRPPRRGILEEILSSVFPRVCPLCKKRIGSDGTGFCPVCLAGFRIIRPPFCRSCGEPLPNVSERNDLLCARCLMKRHKPRAPVFPVRSVAIYEGNLRRSILSSKYGEHTVMAVSLGRFLSYQFTRLFPACAFDRIVPVPLHPKGLRERGFNQCISMAKPLSKQLNIPMELHSVKRIRYTPSQSASGPKDRRRNLQGAFRVCSPSGFRGQSVLMVDDVYTSGATLENLACSLLASGARSVTGLTLARSPAVPASEGGERPCSEILREKGSLDTEQMLD